MSCCTNCLFGLFKLIYILLTSLVLGIHINYIRTYLSNVNDLESFFNHNHFAHFMGMFLGFLFRISGLLSAIKEKIALTCTYSLFLVLILLISRKMDIIFAIHAITSLYAMLFVLTLKYIRHKKKRHQMRHQTSRNNNNNNTSSQQSRNSSTTTGTTTIGSSTTNNTNNNNTHRSSSITVDLLDDPAGRAINVLPSAPSFNESLNQQQMPNDNNDNNNIPPMYPGYPPINHTPPPSYTELFEQTKQ